MPRPKSLIHELAALKTAATKLYCAGRWVRLASAAPKEDEKLWEALRVALGLPVGTDRHLPN